MKPTLQRRLSNGMALLIVENHAVAVATADVWVRTGAADEPGELAGVSHFLEHMLFKGTERYGLGEIERAIENVGGLSNAATSYDYTHYYVTLPSEHLGVAIDMLAEMTRHSTLDSAELEKERLVILEEYRRKQDSPAGVLYERLYSEMFESGPYHESVIGRVETIQAIDRNQMLDYYHKRYTPETMTLVVSGDVDPQAVAAGAEKAFGGLTRPLVTLRPNPPVHYGVGKQIHIEKPTGGEHYVAFAFPAPGMQQLDRVLALDMAQFILGEGRAAVLYQNLKEKQGVCSSVGAYALLHRADSMFVVTATCTAGQRAALREALQSELTRFKAAPPDAGQMERARRLLASAHRFSMETSGGAATNTGYYATLTGTTQFLDGYLTQLERLTAEDVAQAMAHCLGPDGLDKTLVEVSVGPSEPQD